MATVAAIVLNYNYGRFLTECLDSISHQTHDSIRLILVDDASTDESREIIEKWLSNTSVTTELVLKEENRGPAHSYNLAIGRLTEADEYVAVIDADDIWQKDKFAIQVAAFEDVGPDFTVVYSDTSQFDDITKEVTAVPSILLRDGEQPIERLLSSGSYFALNSALIRGTAIRAIAPLDERMRVCDYPMWLALSRTGRFGYAPGHVGSVRMHGTSMSRNEHLTGDRLRLLGRNATSADERRAARVRGRHLLNAASIAEVHPPFGAYVEYGRGARDWRAAPASAIAAIPGTERLMRRIRRT